MRVSDKAGADKTTGDNPHIHTQSASHHISKTLHLKHHVSRRGDSLG